MRDYLPDFVSHLHPKCPMYRRELLLIFVEKSPAPTDDKVDNFAVAAPSRQTEPGARTKEEREMNLLNPGFR